VSPSRNSPARRQVVTDRWIVRARLTNQFDLHRADFGVGRRLGLPQNLLAYRQVEPVNGELGDDALFRFGVPKYVSVPVRSIPT
jgi:hypothetical protein